MIDSITIDKFINFGAFGVIVFLAFIFLIKFLWPFFVSYVNKVTDQMAQERKDNMMVLESREKAFSDLLLFANKVIDRLDNLDDRFNRFDARLMGIEKYLTTKQTMQEIVDRAAATLSDTQQRESRKNETN